MEQGIKELKEVISAFELVYLTGKKVMKDGKIDFSDAKYAMEFTAQMNVLVAAVDGIALVKGEAMDIQAEEAKELIGQFYDMAKKAQEV